MTLDLQKKVSMCFDRKDCQESTQERGSEARIPQGPSLIPQAFGTPPPPVTFIHDTRQNRCLLSCLLSD